MMYLRDGEVKTMRLSRKPPNKQGGATSPSVKPASAPAALAEPAPAAQAPTGGIDTLSEESFELVQWPSLAHTLPGASPRALSVNC